MPTLDYTTDLSVPYREPEDTYARERCVLDLYRPTGAKGFATVLFFHGGGLISGEKYVPEPLKNRGWAVAGCEYRLHPHVHSPTHIEDAAAAVAWVYHNIARYGGDPGLIAVTGFSAGAYLTAMLALDPSYLARHGINADRLLAYAPQSGQAVTHMTTRKEQGVPLPEWRPTIDRLAPLYHVRPDAAPMIFITGDWPLDMHCRAYENAYLVAMLKFAGHPDVHHIALDGVGHDESHPRFWPPTIALIERQIEARRLDERRAAPTTST